MPRHPSSVRRVVRGVYVPADEADDLFRRLTAVSHALAVECVFSHTTAAYAFGAPLPPRREDDIHLSVASDRQPPRRAGIVGHEARLPPGHVTRRRGVAFTSPPRTFVDLGELLSLPDLVAVGDHLVGRQLCSVQDIERVLGWAGSRRGVRRARRAAKLINEAARSRPESLIRVWCKLAGLPDPEANGWIFDPQGRARYRGDLVFRATRVIVEYDGRHHREASQFAADLRRRNDLQLWGWRIVHVEASMLREPTRVVELVREALRTGA
jgi:hypothetical protein